MRMCQFLKLTYTQKPRYFQEYLIKTDANTSLTSTSSHYYFTPLAVISYSLEGNETRKEGILKKINYRFTPTNAAILDKTAVTDIR